MCGVCIFKTLLVKSVKIGFLFQPQVPQKFKFFGRNLGLVCCKDCKAGTAYSSSHNNSARRNGHSVMHKKRKKEKQIQIITSDFEINVYSAMCGY